jgi:hypothetical protein
VRNKAKLGQDRKSGGRHIQGAHCAKQSQFRASARGWARAAEAAEREMCQTNPIPGRAGGTGSGRRGAWVRSCETKPVLRLPIWDCGLRIGYRVALGRPACGSLPPARAGRLCETNPIWPGLGTTRSPVGERCETNPIPGDAGWDGGGGTKGRGGNRAKQTQSRRSARAAEGRMCKTNPITRSGAPRRCRGVGRRDTPLFHYSIIPPFQSDADCAKRTQFAAPTPCDEGLARSSYLRWSRLYWVVTGNRRTAMERGQL